MMTRKYFEKDEAGIYGVTVKNLMKLVNGFAEYGPENQDGAIDNEILVVANHYIRTYKNYRLWRLDQRNFERSFISLAGLSFIDHFEDTKMVTDTSTLKKICREETGVDLDNVFDAEAYDRYCDQIDHIVNDKWNYLKAMA